MAQVLAPARLDISQEFTRGFEGMTEATVTLDELLRAREESIEELVGRMPDEHRRFLVSVKKGKQDWGLLDTPHAEKLPAVQWRLQNLAKIDPKKREQLIGNLLRALGIRGVTRNASRTSRPRIRSCMATRNLHDLCLSLSFFEAVILDALIRAGGREALILADVDGVRASLSERGAQRVGKDYEVEPVSVSKGVRTKPLAAADAAECVLRGISSGSFGHRKEISVTQLRQRVLDELQRRNYSPATTRGYIHAIKQFAECFGKSPEQLGGEEIRQFELHLLKEKKLAPGTVEGRISALRFLYKKVLKRRDIADAENSHADAWRRHLVVICERVHH